MKNQNTGKSRPGGVECRAAHRRLLALIALLIAWSVSLQSGTGRAQAPDAAPPLLRLQRLTYTTNSAISAVQVELNGDRNLYPMFAGFLSRQHAYWIETSPDLSHWTRYGGPTASYFPGVVTLSSATNGTGTRFGPQLFLRAGDAGTTMVSVGSLEAFFLSRKREIMARAAEERQLLLQLRHSKRAH
jgi:hypothetical protein